MSPTVQASESPVGAESKPYDADAVAIGSVKTTTASASFATPTAPCDGLAETMSAPAPSASEVAANGASALAATSVTDPAAAAKASVGWTPAPTPVRLAAALAARMMTGAPFAVTAETSREERSFGTAAQSASS